MDPALIRFTGRLSQRSENLEPNDWVRVRHGAYYPRAAWTGLNPMQKHAVLVHASVPRWQERHVVSHWSAAALWEIPIIGAWPAQAHVTSENPRRRSNRSVVVHRVGDLPASTSVEGIRVTDPLQTVVDLVRLSDLRSGLTAADHALHSYMFTSDALTATSGSLEPGSRGAATARLVAELADARAESPLESLSRAIMFKARLPRPELQVLLRDVDGEFGRADFGWPGLFGECDGYLKYGSDLTGGDPSRAVFAEKQREDRMRRQRYVARWGWRDAYEETPLVRILRGKGLRPVPKQRWIA